MENSRKRTPFQKVLELMSASASGVCCSIENEEKLNQRPWRLFYNVSSSWFVQTLFNQSFFQFLAEQPPIKYMIHVFATHMYFYDRGPISAQIQPQLSFQSPRIKEQSSIWEKKVFQWGKYRKRFLSIKPTVHLFL